MALRKKTIIRTGSFILAVLLIAAAAQYGLFYITLHRKVFTNIEKVSIEPYINNIIANIDATVDAVSDNKYERYLLNIYSNILLCENELDRLNQYYSLYFDTKGDSWGEAASTINDLLSGLRMMKSVIERQLIDGELHINSEALFYARDELAELLQIIREHKLEDNSDESEYVERVKDLFSSFPASEFMIRLESWVL